MDSMERSNEDMKMTFPSHCPYVTQMPGASLGLTMNVDDDCVTGIGTAYESQS